MNVSSVLASLRVWVLLQLQSLAVPHHVLLDASRSHKPKLYAGATVTELHVMDDKGKASTVVCLRFLIWVEEDPFTGSCLATTFCINMPLSDVIPAKTC